MPVAAMQKREPLSSLTNVTTKYNHFKDGSVPSLVGQGNQWAETGHYWVGSLEHYERTPHKQPAV